MRRFRGGLQQRNTVAMRNNRLQSFLLADTCIGRVGGYVAVPMHGNGWNGDSVRVADPSFNLCDLVQKVATYQQIEDPADDLLMSLILSSSPLTSLESSACSTPVLLDDETPQLQHRVTIEGTIEALKKVGPSAEPDLHRGNSTASATQMGKRKRARSRKDDLAASKRKNERNKQQSKANRKKKRQREVELQISMPPVASKVHQRYTQQMQPLQSAIDTKENSNCTQNAYVGKKSAYDCDMAYTLDDLVGESSRFNFQLIKWNGITPKPIVDSQGRIFGHLGGQPDDATWKQDNANSATTITINVLAVPSPSSAAVYLMEVVKFAHATLHTETLRRIAMLFKDSTGRQLSEGYQTIPLVCPVLTVLGWFITFV
ncbi:hypothetical protein BJ165DRAFT_1410771 [Panaeolus papilionaceus]|nr:hypothetical protein BJ165DRAFT_1410771 [Panaeolus papilionaceus]